MISSQPSGYVETASGGLSKSFTIVDDKGTHGYNHLYCAKRYGKLFILKALDKEHKDSAYHQDLLRKEFEMAAAFDHPNIVKVHYLEEVKTNDIGLCIVMDYVDGSTLADFLKEKHPDNVYDRLVAELLDAMRYLHSRQLVHCDLKPSNIMITRNGNYLKIIDFGLSDSDSYVELKNNGGTEGFAAPEQLSGGELDCRTDIYAFGKILQSGFPKRYQSISQKCINPNPDNRFQNVDEIRKAIKIRKTASSWSKFSGIVVAIIAIIFIINYLKNQNSDINQNILVEQNENVVADTIKADTIKADTIKVDTIKVDTIKDITIEKSTIQNIENQVVEKYEVPEVNVSENEKDTEGDLPVASKNSNTKPGESTTIIIKNEKPTTVSSNNRRMSQEKRNVNTLQLNIVKENGRFGLLHNGSDTVMYCDFEYLSVVKKYDYFYYFLGKTNNYYGTFYVYTFDNQSDTCLYSQVVLDFKYDTIIPKNISCNQDMTFLNYYSVVGINGKYGFVQAFGRIGEKFPLGKISNRIILGCEYDEVELDKKYTYFRIGDKWGIADARGDFSTECEYDTKPIIYYNKAVLVYKGKTGVINISTKSVFLPFEYEISPESDEFVRVKKDGKYAYVPVPNTSMEPKGSVASIEKFINYLKYASYVYDYAEDFHDGKVVVEKDGERFSITKNEMYFKWSR